MVLGLFNKKASSLLGIDIGADSVRLLQLGRAGHRYRVEAYGIEPLSAGAVIEKNITEPEVVGHALARLLLRVRPTSKNAAVALAGSAVICKTVEMEAALTDDERETRLRLEADQYIPYPLDDAAIDFDVQGYSMRNPDRVNVLLAACRKEHIEVREAALGLAGLKARVVDLEQCALERAFAQVGDQTVSDMPVALIDVGSALTTLNILRDGRIIFTREQSFGTHPLSHEVRRRYGLSLEEAALAQKQGGLPDDYRLEVLPAFEDAWLRQLMQSWQLFLESGGQHPPDCILLAGAHAVLPGLSALIQERLGIPASVIDPFSGMSVGSKVDSEALAADAPALMIACGLALRGFD